MVDWPPKTYNRPWKAATPWAYLETALISKPAEASFLKLE